MRSSGLARRYVQPLFYVALEKGELDKIASDLFSFDEMLSQSSELRSFLADPSVERLAKRGVMEKLFDDVSPYTLNFVKVVIDKNRSAIFDMVYPLFRDMLNEHNGITAGIVETAVPLDDDLFVRLQKTLETRFEKRLELERKIDPDLLGGVRVRIGNMVIDASVRGRLNKLKEMLISE
ncbi:MAG: ATP synthase F1 subunit delta [Candidatus Electryoneaceae bacterium]|nr:ATP synthase F1 subunit delta [Candidatus Electryoneaceae bacterium]